MLTRGSAAEDDESEGGRLAGGIAPAGAGMTGAHDGLAAADTAGAGAVGPALLPLLDRAMLDAVAACLPPARLAASLRTIAVRARDLLEAVQEEASDRLGLVERVHALAGSAGLLGFQLLCQACQTYECATLGEAAEIEPARAGLVSVLTRTLRLLE